MTAEENNYGKLLEELHQLKQQVQEVAQRTGGMLSSRDFLRLVITENIEEAKKVFWKRQWDHIDRKLIIAPFNPQRLTPFSYDLSVGDQIYLCSQETVKELTDKDDSYLMGPRETIVVKTKEFIALPPYYSATVWPRFRMVTEAIFQSMVKIDPTWHGELGVAITNLSGGKYPIRRGNRFATLIVYELSTPTAMFLYRKEDMPDPQGVPLGDKIDQHSIKKKLDDDGNLKAICEIANGEVRLKKSPDFNAFMGLLKLDESEEWKNAIIERVGSFPREMDALGLTRLELIRPKTPQVQKLTRADIQTAKCEPADLERAAMNHGEPFDLLPGIPDLIMENIEREIGPRIRAEVEANLFPKIVTLTLTVLGFLSLIIAVTAFVVDKYRQQSPFAGVDWPGTAVVALGILGLVLLISLLVLILRRSPDSRAMDRLKKDVEKLKRKKEET